VRGSFGERFVRALGALLSIVLAGCSSAPREALGVRDDPLGTLLAARNSLRFYDGAPPVIPHEVAGWGREGCLNCHMPGSTENGERVAAPRSHPAWGDCRQCHVERRTTEPFFETDFTPLRYASRGPRQTPISPPLIPHLIQNREDCAVCHIGAQAPTALRAAHGGRPNCRQCHLPSGR